MQFEKKLLYAFLGGLTQDELEHYISDICQVDCYTNNNSVIVKRIMRMTSQKFGIVKNDYNQINGLIMFAEGDIVKKYTNIDNAVNIQSMMEWVTLTLTLKQIWIQQLK